MKYNIWLQSYNATTEGEEVRERFPDSRRVYPQDNKKIFISKDEQPYTVLVYIDKIALKCHINPDAALTIIGKYTYEKYFAGRPLQISNLTLIFDGLVYRRAIYTSVNVELNAISAAHIPMYIAGENQDKIVLGRDWMSALKFNQVIFNETSKLEECLLHEFPLLFTSGLGVCRRTMKLELCDEEPVCLRAHILHPAERLHAEAEMLRLQLDGTIYRQEGTQYATPVLLVKTAYDRYRIIPKYNLTINPKLKMEINPFPDLDKMCEQLKRGEEFSTIRMTCGYDQVMLSPESQSVTTITSHVGTFAYRRVPYGLACAPQKFHEILQEILKSVPDTFVYLDDIYVTGANRIIHFLNLRLVLTLLQEEGFILKRNDCKFFQLQVPELGINMPDIENLTLDLFDDEPNFKENIITSPNTAYNMADTKLLIQVNGTENVVLLNADASSVGAVLARRSLPEDHHLSVLEQIHVAHNAIDNHQMYRQVLALCLALNKFHNKVYGRKLVLITSCQQMYSIFGCLSKPYSANTQIERMFSRLCAYDYTIKYVASGHLPYRCIHPLSCLPSLCSSYSIASNEPFDENITALNFNDIARETSQDPILKQILQYIKYGWPDEEDGPTVTPEITDELSLSLDCIMLRNRVAIPESLRMRLLQFLHKGHAEKEMMLRMANKYVYWPGLEQDIVKAFNECSACQSAPVPQGDSIPDIETAPWRLVYVTFFSFKDVLYLVAVDAYSRWVEVESTRTTSDRGLIKCLWKIFARFGVPKVLITKRDDIQFYCKGFVNFCLENNIRTGMVCNDKKEFAEIKAVLERAHLDYANPREAVISYLFTHRNTGRGPTGESPATLMLGFSPRSPLSSLLPPSEQPLDYREIALGERVFVRKERGDMWKMAHVHQKSGGIYKLMGFDGHSQFELQLEDIIPALLSDQRSSYNNDFFLKNQWKHIDCN